MWAAAPVPPPWAVTQQQLHYNNHMDWFTWHQLSIFPELSIIGGSLHFAAKCWILQYVEYDLDLTLKVLRLGSARPPEFRWDSLDALLRIWLKRCLMAPCLLFSSSIPIWRSPTVFHSLSPPALRIWCSFLTWRRTQRGKKHLCLPSTQQSQGFYT